MCTAGADLGDHEAMAGLVSDTAWKADILWLPQDHSEKSKLINERALCRISGTMDWREQIAQFEQL
jgi:hypothetical protein